MELFGLYRGLQEVYRISTGAATGLDQEVKQVHIISDSKYVLDGAERFSIQWQKNGWKTVAGGEVKNQDLWEKVVKGQEVLRGLGFRFQYELVKGHAGSEANERVDQIAVKYSKGDPIQLFSGKIKDYPVSLEAKSVFTAVYLAYVDGKLYRFSTWDECKKQVEGKKAAKYKKVKNRLEEQETLQAWGLA
jgi:ribonuclease HI